MSYLKSNDSIFMTLKKETVQISNVIQGPLRIDCFITGIRLVHTAACYVL